MHWVLWWRIHPGQWACLVHQGMYQSMGETVVTHEGKCFPLGLLWDQYSVQCQSSRFPPSLGHQPCWQAGCSSGQSDGFGSHGHKATPHLHSPLGSPAHDTSWFEQARNFPALFTATGNESQKSITQGLLC